MANQTSDDDLATEQESLLQFIYLCPHGMAQFDRNGLITMLNPAFARLAMPLLPVGRTFDNLVHLLTPFLPELPSLLQDYVGDGMICDGMRVHLGPAHPGQDPRILSLTIVRMGANRHMAVLYDVTQQVAQERRLKEGEAWIAALVQVADKYAVFGVNADGRICDWNVSAERLFGRTSAEVVGKSASGIVTSGTSGKLAFRDRLRKATREGWHLDEGWRLRGDGTRFWGACMISPLEVDGNPEAQSGRYLMVVRDITERHHSAEELRQALTSDFLTGLLNRRTFLERADRELQRALRHGSRSTIAMVDADLFKTVNDTYGHAAGDAALRAIAGVLQAEMRKDDFVGRIGGEEFAVMMLDTLPEVAENISERLRAGVAALRLEHQGRSIALTISIGIATDSGSGLRQMLIDADAALYEAKRSGRNRVCSNALRV
jgi:diguanylate cyclase (GGDEF)-like protein/PAS domain S-box-containing protein